jgi:glycosyltransferase involved in cell wall biosynthesis
VLAVRAGGLPEIVHDGKNGFLVDSREPRKLADALDFIFQNPDKAKKAAEEGLRTVREKFSLERQIREVEHTLEDILKKQIID